jgi:threonylcarbamoyladenosine tRNA methylthiotransferase MtaB
LILIYVRIEKNTLVFPMKTISVAITTLGCKVNQYDSATIEEALAKRGWTIVDFKTPADVYIINTCTVTHKTDYQSRQLIRRAHKTNPRARIIVTGCYAQAAPTSLQKIPGVNLILGNREKQRITDFLTDQLLDNSHPQVVVSSIKESSTFTDPPLTSFSKHTRAFLKIQDGCESFCSYCIVPHVRGNCRSLDPKEVLRRLATLASQGFKEVVLTGVHLGAYGIDHNPSSTLLALLQLIERTKPLPRIRLSSLEPMDISAELADLISSSSIICPHLHLPLQSGDNDVLKRMKRPYSGSDLKAIIAGLVSKIPQICLGVDVMVGFPGETETQFENTYNLLNDLPISYFHIFPYSRREKTEAASFPAQISPPVIKSRKNRLNRLNRQKLKYFYSRYLGKKLKVLFEETRDRNSGLLKGRSRNYIPVLLEGPDSLKNSEVEVETVQVEGSMVRGRLLSR